MTTISVNNVSPDLVVDDPASEWRLRVQLAAAYRLFDHFGWTEMIYNHITVRVPGPERHFLINPFGLHYTEVTASNLVNIGLDGTIIGSSEFPVNPAGFVIHSALHAAIPEAHCIMHTHTTAGMAVASSQRGLAPTNFYGAMMFGAVGYHDFEGLTVRDRAVDGETLYQNHAGNGIRRDR
jgi:ribulose-5-phosphate 4-epimerase/fuculose-1-phosphate aldolase